MAQETDRYEPLPGLAALPRHVWRRLPRLARIAVGSVPLIALILALVFGPGIERSKDDRAHSEARLRAQARAARIAELRAEQRPRSERSSSVAPVGATPERRLSARESMLDEAAAAMLADARVRVRAGALRGPIRAVECEPFPRTVQGIGAHEDLAQRRGRYSCLAVTARLPRGAGIIGHPYRAMIDFETGRYAYCKISGRPGEGSIPARLPVTVPKTCGGR